MPVRPPGRQPRWSGTVADDTAPPDSCDADIGPALRRALKAPRLGSDQLARMRPAVEAEWQRVVHQHGQFMPLRRRALIAASLLSGVALTCWTVAGRNELGSVGVVAGGAPGSLRVEQALFPDSSLGPGGLLHTGVRAVAVSMTCVALAGGGLLKLKPGTRILSTAVHELTLDGGTVYVDIDPSRPHGSLSVRTPFGLVQHLGTQFEATVLANALRVRVREGVVRVTGADSTSATAGEEILLRTAGPVQRRLIATDGPEWNWVQEPPSEFVAEGRPLSALLLWTARETGRRLEFADERSRQIAERTVLHGSILGLSPDNALQAMLATTTLAAKMRPGLIIVNSSSGGPAPTSP